MDAKLYGVRATQDFVPKTPAERYEENMVGFYYKLSVMLQEENYMVTDHFISSWQRWLLMVFFDSLLNK
jgi:hypothetical protein